MEGESTLGVLSGFVLGALTFQHLNTNSDTVSWARGCRPRRPCPQLPLAVRARGPGRPPWLSSGPFRPGQVWGCSSRRPPAGRGRSCRFPPSLPTTSRGIPAPCPASGLRLGPGGRPRLPAAGGWPVRVLGLRVAAQTRPESGRPNYFQCRFPLQMQIGPGSHV